MSSAVRAGRYSLEDRQLAEEGQLVLNGVGALARVPRDVLRADRRAGLHTAAFVSGYPGSPLGTFDLELAKHQNIDGIDVVHRPGVNEELAATSVMGSQTAGLYGPMRYDGVVGFWYGKSPGLDRAADALRHAQFVGVNRHSGAVAYVGDDPASKSSSIPSASEATLTALHIPVLCPGNPQEVLDLGLHAVAMSRSSSLWTGLKIVTAVADGTGSVVVHPDRISIRAVLDDSGNPVGRDRNEGHQRARLLEYERLISAAYLPTALRYAQLNGLNTIEVNPADAWLGIVAPSHTFEVLLDTLKQLGLDKADLERRGIRLLRLRMLNPLDEPLVREFAAGLDTVLVAEEKGPFLESAIRTALYGTAGAPKILGKHDETGRDLLPVHGLLDVAALREPLRRVLLTRLPEEVLRPIPRPATIGLPLLARGPAFCSGCPHSTSTQAPADALVSVGIGCSSMSMEMDPARVGSLKTFTQMGGEGSQWIGVEPFVEAEHMFQNVGDGTYFHSAQLAVQAAVAAGSNVTYKLLHNAAIAMTGGQSSQGALPVPAIARILLQQGVRRVIVTTEDTGRFPRGSLPKGAECWDRTRVVEAQETLKAVSGVTVLIHDQQCAAEARRLRKRGQQPDPVNRVVIATRVCEGCGDCGAKSACLSVEPMDTEYGRKTTIDQASCNKDYSCLHGDCPAFITARPRRRGSSGRRAVVRTHPEPPPVPEPAPRPGPVDFRVRMPGIGGTGVVTVNQILATAAELDGHFVAALDQTGLAQKGGTVVSDLRVGSAPVDGSAAGVRGDLDLYLAFDILAGSGPAILSAATPDRTVAVVSTSEVPTMAMVTSPEVTFPPLDTLRAGIDDQTRAADNRYLDARKLARQLTGSTTVANILLLGVAAQAGLLPISVASIKQAIELNGVAVRANLNAFDWGRCWEHDPSAVERAVAQQTPRRESSSPAWLSLALVPFDIDPYLRDLVRERTTDLMGYQGSRPARRYLTLLTECLAVEEAAVGGTAFTEAVARGFHKLIAYKDEYEVARLLLDPGVRAQIEQDSGIPDPVISYNLHPPLLRQLGMKNKIRLGPWSRPVLAVLRAGRRLRGGPFDPFGHGAVRRTERALIGEYEAAIRAALPSLAAEDHARAVDLARSPDLVRGYEDVKLAGVAQFRTALAELALPTT